MERGHRFPTIEDIDYAKEKSISSFRKRFNEPLGYVRLSLAAGLGLALVACAPDSTALAVITPEPTLQVAATPEPTSTPSPTPTPEPIPTPDAILYTLSLSCPAPKEFCQNPQVLPFRGNPALGFSLPARAEIKAIAPIVDFNSFAITGQQRVKGIWQSFINQDTCFTATYTFPFETNATKIELLPQSQGFILGRVNDTFIAGLDVNLIVQLQRRRMDKSTEGQPTFRRCSVTNLRQGDFGPYHYLDGSIFR